MRTEKNEINHLPRCLSAILILIMSLSLLFTGADTADAASCTTIHFQAQYCQSACRSTLSAINSFRTGRNAWYWNSTNTKKVVVSGLKKLTYDYRLEKIAMQRCAEIAVSFSHTRPNGTKQWTLYKEMNYTYSNAGENIAAGYTTAAEALEALMEDDENYAGQGHRRNMLSKGVNRIGIAGCKVNGVWYWVQEFASSTASVGSAAANNKSTSVTVKCLTSNLSVTLSPSYSTCEMDAGETRSLPTVKVRAKSKSSYFGNGIPLTDTVTQTTGNSSVASVSGKKIVAKSEGTTSLKASALGKSVSVSVTVNED